MNKLLIGVILAIVAGCSSSASPLNNLISKELTPPSDKALIYIIRPFRFASSAISPGFALNGQFIGKIESNRYFFFYSYPQKITLVHVTEGRSSLLKIDLQPGRTYYLTYSLAEHNYSLSRTVSYSQLSQEEGKQYLQELNLSANFKPVVVGLPQTNTSTVDAHQVVTSEAKPVDYLKYDDNSKSGVIRFRSGFGQRNLVINRIEDICVTKNVALLTGETKHNSASYKTLDESIENNLIQIKFQCLY